MSHVKSTYNFVPAPAEDQVFKPDWADKVSHDIPFEDGESGEIELTITAETPIFIRNGHAKGVVDNDFSHAIINGEKKYLIPATSLKGMTRNVLEILSFSRLNKSLVNDNRYSFRDLTRNSEYMKSYNSNNVNAGWLKEDNEGNWSIDECDVNHIHHADVDKALGTNFRELYLEKQPEPEHKTASAKYQLTKGKSLISTFGLKERTSKPKGLAVYDVNGKNGTIVFTGQSGPRKEKNMKIPSGKVHEFVFFEGIRANCKLSAKQVKDFKFIYSDHDKNNISPDWEYWRDTLEKGGRIPVFFNKIGDNVKHFGLSYMYKLPYENSVHEMFPIASYDSNVDLATTIFGYTEGETGLKGRVYFGNAISDNAKPINTSKEILGGPKASFTPFYLEQKNKNSISTYQEKGSLKGFKKYPVHSIIKNIKYSIDQLKNDKVFTFFTPLDKGSTFNDKIRFHNLKQVELGALISALSFHNNSDKFSHSIGGAKPLGFGNIKIEIKNIEKFNNSLHVFEYEMDQHSTKKMNCKWLNSQQVVELLSISSIPNSPLIEEHLDYPSLGKGGKNGTADNEFIQIKNNKTFLQKYSSLNAIDSIKSLLSKEAIDKWEKLRIENENVKKQLKIELEKNFISFIGKANNDLSNYEFDSAELNYRKALNLKNDNSLSEFLKKIEDKKIEKLEIDAYNLALNSENKDVLEDFLTRYPFSKFKEEIDQKLKLKHAISGIPTNIIDKNNLKQFANNTDNWVKKLLKESQTIASLGFEKDHIELLLKIWELENSNHKLVKEWHSNETKTRFSVWYGDDKANDLISKIK